MTTTTTRNKLLRRMDVAEDADALAHIKSPGYAQAPVVITDDDHLSRFRPEKVKDLADVGVRPVAAA